MSASSRVHVLTSLHQYLAAHCVPASDMVSRWHLRTATHNQFVLPSYRLATYGLRAFSAAGPKLWNSLPRLLRENADSTASFGQSLKTCLLLEY